MKKYVMNKIENVRETTVFSLIALWMMIPILKNLTLTYNMVFKFEYGFMMIVGIVGITYLVLDIYKSFKSSKDKKEYIKEIMPIIVLTLFMLWTLVSSICAPNNSGENAFWGTYYRKEGYITYLTYAGFFACTFLMKSKENKNMLTNMLVIVAILNIIMVGLRNQGIFENILEKKPMSRTVFLQFNHYGYYLMLATTSALFLFITQKNIYIKILNLLEFSFLLYYLILNNTFGCYLAFSVMLIIFMGYCIYKKENRLIAVGVILIFILMSFLTPETRIIVNENIDILVKDITTIVKVILSGNIEPDLLKTGTGRMKLWKNGLIIFSDRPILGYGPDNFGDKYLALNVHNDRPHNLLIQLGLTSGIIGIVTYVTAIGIIFVRGLKKVKFENPLHIIAFFNICVYLISAMFGNSMYYTSPYFFIFLGLLMCENIHSKGEDNKTEV